MRKAILATAAAVSLLSVPALGQTTADPTLTAEPVEERDNDFPWGLLGLLGLAGLLGRKRDDHHRTDTNRRVP